MKYLWNHVDQLNYTTTQKQKLFLFLNSLIFGLLGFLFWIPVQFFTLRTLDWLVCFVGYPVMFLGLLGGILYLYNHEFKA